MSEYACGPSFHFIVLAARCISCKDGCGQQTQVRCRYLDTFEKREGAWKITNRVVAYESLLLEDAPESPFAKGMQMATRGSDDPLWALLG